MPGRPPRARAQTGGAGRAGAAQGRAAGSLAEARALTLDQNRRERPRSWTGADPPRSGARGGRPAGVDRSPVLVRAAPRRHPLGGRAGAGLHPRGVDAPAVDRPLGAGVDLPALTGLDHHDQAPPPPATFMPLGMTTTPPSVTWKRRRSSASS